MTPANLAGQFGDTTYTKVFVGGLAWETQKETMKKYFEQFGEILEAVVITDKTTGRSKGYGFVTFREPDAAMRACVDAAPVIDGRRANCNLASLGVQRSKPSTPKHGSCSYFFLFPFSTHQSSIVATRFDLLDLFELDSTSASSCSDEFACAMLRTEELISQSLDRMNVEE
ncbi:hypothetical protein RJ640_002883 [Escallonia rubra]|uniref:RRM domain-containing protein n=1 Tax=Escallonia rubra TaxID=112253 RepID=A0AA88RM77_9ASTE|nr:hypothetical protein RJ640_002883 [Escallonia rubra]